MAEPKDFGDLSLAPYEASVNSLTGPRSMVGNLSRRKAKPPAGLEKNLVSATIAAIKGRGGWAFKVHGGPYQIAGIPDVLGVLNGYFIGIELKRRPGMRATPLQMVTQQIIEKAGGHCITAANMLFVNEFLDRLENKPRRIKK